MFRLKRFQLLLRTEFWTYLKRHIQLDPSVELFKRQHCHQLTNRSSSVIYLSCYHRPLLLQLWISVVEFVTAIPMPLHYIMVIPVNQNKTKKLSVNRHTNMTNIYEQVCVRCSVRSLPFLGISSLNVERNQKGRSYFRYVIMWIYEPHQTH